MPLHDGVLELIAQAVYAGGLRNNRDFLLPRLPRRAGRRGGDAAGPVAGRFAGPITEQDPRVLALFDPQTSGGLLMAVAPEKHALLLAALEHGGVGGWTVGEVAAGAARRPSRSRAEPRAARIREAPPREPRAQARRPRLERPSEEDIAGRAGSATDFALRVLSVLPFLLVRRLG